MIWPMEQHTFFLALMLLVVIFGSVSAFIVIKKKNSRNIPHHEQHIMELIIREQEKSKRLGKRLESLEEEMAGLKCELNEIDKQSVPTENKHGNSFQNNLQYHTFMQKNQEIVLLLQNGLSIEKAAKVSNRSVREVEMVEAVLKQRSYLQKNVD